MRPYVLSLTLALSTLAPLPALAQPRTVPPRARIDTLLASMTLEEKAGQLTQWGAQQTPTGPRVRAGSEEDIKRGKVGSLLGAYGAATTRALQRAAVEQSRLRVPLLFAFDVIHGFRTIFPVPLAEAAAFDPALAERTARAAASEATAHGIHWTYAPMVDIGRDARWGRVVEGAGEDPFLGAALATARVRGFRGAPGRADAMLATAKHFVAYGAPEAGREYNTVDLSERTLHEVYLPPFRAAIEAGADAVMPAFNELSGVPMHAHAPLLRDLLRGRWGFRGIFVSDYTGIKELMAHGIAETAASAGAAAMAATVDVDMISDIYANDLPALVNGGRVSMAEVDAAVRRVLEAKERLGLFDDPYRYADSAREQANVLRPETRALAREAARKSIVLLKNEGPILPLAKSLKSLAVIGSLAVDAQSTLGAWAAAGRPEDSVTVLEGIQRAARGTKVVYVRGASPDTNDASGIAEAERAARSAQAVVLVLGESEGMSGEAHSRSFVGLPGAQQALFDRIVALGKPLVVVLMNGRPLALERLAARAPAMLESWYLGTEMGHAVADVLFGDENPSGKLPMTFPRTTGQVPIYYNHKRTGRPPNEHEPYTSKYLDVHWTPLFPFGHGLSYTSFRYEAPRLSRTQLAAHETLTVSTIVHNSGARAGDEVVQLYLRDEVASVTRPVRSLRGFRRVALAPGERKEVRFELSARDFALLDAALRPVVEPGHFTVFVGGSSATENGARFEVKNGGPLSCEHLVAAPLACGVGSSLGPEPSP